MPNTPKQKKLDISKAVAKAQAEKLKSIDSNSPQKAGGVKPTTIQPTHVVIAAMVLIAIIGGIGLYWYYQNQPIVTPPPTTTPPTPPIGATAWFSINPVQCQGNAWEQYWETKYGSKPSIGTTINPRAVVSEYFSSQGIEIQDFQSNTTQGIVCSACSCPTGETYSVLVDNANESKMVSLGWSKGLPTIEPDKTVEVSTVSNLYVTAQGIGVQIKNNLSEPIFLAGCNPYVFQQSDVNAPDAWKTITPKQCIVEGDGVKVPSTESFNSDQDSVQQAGIYRLKVDYSLGCTGGKPLSQANCRESHSTVSQPFTVNKETKLFNEELVVTKAASLNLSLSLKNLFLDIYNNSDQDLYYGTCNAFYVQAKDANGYWFDTTNNYKCSSEGVARIAPKMRKTTESIRITRLGDVRLDFRYGAYCNPKLPLAESNCKFTGHSYTFYKD